MRRFKTSVIGDIGSAATPTIIGGGYLKLLFLVGYGYNPGRATLLMVLGSLEDLLFFSLALPVMIYLTHAWDNPYVLAAVKNLVSHWPALVGLAVGISVIVYLYNRKKRRMEKSRRNGESSEQQEIGLWGKLVLKFRHYKEDFLQAVVFITQKGKGTLLLATALTGIGWACRYASINALVLGLGYEVDLLLFTLLHWVVFSTMTMIPTPGAVGGAEISFALVFGGLLPPGVIPIITGVWRFVTYYMVVTAGAIYMAIAGPKFPSGKGEDIER